MMMQESKREILILCNDDGGLYRFRRSLLLELLRDYHVAVSCPKGKYADELIGMGVEFIDTSLDRRGTNPIRDLGLLRFYKSLIKQRKPLAVLTYTIKPNIYGGIACRRFKEGTAYIPNITGLGTAVEGGGIAQKLLIAMYRYALKGAYCVCFQNEDNRRFFKRRINISRDILLCGSGVELNEYAYTPYPTEGEKLQLLFVGRAMRAKGLEELIYTAKRLHNENAPVAFTLVGGCDEAEYEERLNELTRDGTLNWVGEQRNVYFYIRNCHGVVHPSYHEGMSNVLLESAAAGRPVIASNVPGCREAFIDGESGVAFAPRDKEALYSAVRGFIALSHESRERMGRAGRKYVERNFDRRSVISAYTDLIKELV